MDCLGDRNRKSFEAKSQSKLNTRPVSWAWTTDDESSTRSQFPRLHRRISQLEPRQARVSRDEMIDIATFLRDTEPNSTANVSDRDPIEPPPAQGTFARKVMRIANHKRFSRTTSRPNVQFKPSNTVQKISKDGKKYLQIMPYQLRLSELPLPAIDVVELSAESPASNYQRSAIRIAPVASPPQQHRASRYHAVRRATNNLVSKIQESELGPPPYQNSSAGPDPASAYPQEIERPHDGLGLFTPSNLNDDWQPTRIKGVSGPENEPSAAGLGSNHASFSNVPTPSLYAPFKPLPSLPGRLAIGREFSLTYYQEESYMQSEKPDVTRSSQNLTFSPSSSEAKVNLGQDLDGSGPNPTPMNTPAKRSQTSATGHAASKRSGHSGVPKRDNNAQSSPGHGSLGDIFDGSPLPRGNPKSDDTTGVRQSRVEKTRARKLRDLQRLRENVKPDADDEVGESVQVAEADWPQVPTHNTPSMTSDPKNMRDSADAAPDINGKESKSATTHTILITERGSAGRSRKISRKPVHVVISDPVTPEEFPNVLRATAAIPNEPLESVGGLKESHPSKKCSASINPATPPVPPRNRDRPLPNESIPRNSAKCASYANNTLSNRSSTPSPLFSGNKVARLEARIELLEHQNKLLEAALMAVLKTGGKLNHCPCGGTGDNSPTGLGQTPRSVGTKRSSNGSGSSGRASSEKSALEIYMSTRCAKKVEIVEED